MIRTLAFAACFGAAAFSTSLQAQTSFGRLVDPAALAAFAQTTCGSLASSEAHLISRAENSKWDELGRTAATPKGSRAWMVSLKGQPVIVDIARGPTGRTCSASAVTDPASVIKSISSQRKSSPKIHKKGDGRAAIWNASKVGPETSVTYGGGLAMARITYSFVK